MRLRGMILRTGEVAPANGPRRVEFLTRRGRAAIGDALAKHAEVLDVIGGYVEVDRLPYSRPSASNEFDALMKRAKAWDPFRHRLISSMSADRYAAAETTARASLGQIVDAYRDLRAVGGHDRAHRLMHRLGEFVNGTFMCTLKWDGDERVWMERCPVGLGHSDMGMSPGFTSLESCSLCGLDASDCDHFTGVIYEVPAARCTDGRCNICGTGNLCAHAPGDVYPTMQRIVRTDVVLRETSMLNKPRDPRLRITHMQCTENHPPPRAGRPPLRRCLSCFITCNDPRGDLPDAASSADG